MSNEWNLNYPTDDELIPDLPGEHRERKTNVAAVLEKEHATLGDSNSGGEHKQGSAVAFYLATGSIPALDVEGNALAATDNGRLWLDSTTKIFYALDDYSDPTVAGGWLAMGHLLGDIAINTNKFTVARATGNTVVAGTLGVTGVATVAKGSLLASSDAPTTDAMIANKKYIDDLIAAYVTLSAYTNEDSNGDAMLRSHAYKAQTDGQVTAYNVSGTAQSIKGFVNTTGNPADDSEDASLITGNTAGTATGSGVNGITFLVSKDEYFEIVSAHATHTIRWKSFGALSKPVDQD